MKEKKDRRTDTELTDLLRSGNKDAFTEIYHKHWPLLFLHIRRMLGDDELAEDVLQDLFTWLWNKSGEIEFTTSLSAYLYTAARHRVFDQIKHRKLNSSHMQAFAATIEEPRDLLDEQYRLKELVDEINAEIARMPEKMREIFELSRIGQLSHKEIATKLNLSEHTVKKQVQRALKILRERLNLSDTAILILIYLHK